MKAKILLFATVLMITVFVFASVPHPNTIIYEQERAAETLDPAMVIDTASGQILSNVYETLIQPAGTSLTRYAPVLSTNVPSVKDGTILDSGETYIFHIRRGVHFHNGDLLTPQDIVYSLERDVVVGMAGGDSYQLTEPLLPKINGNYVTNLTQWAVKLAGVKSWSDLFATDTSTPKNEKYKKALIDAFNLMSRDFQVKGYDIIIHLPHAYSPFFDSLISSMAMIMDKKWATAHGAWPGTANTWWKYHNPVRQKDPLYSITNGTGPFELYKWVKGREVILERFDAYWKDPAKVKYVVIKTVPEFTTRKLDLIRGNADIISVPPQYIGQVENIKGVEVSRNIPDSAEYQISFAFSVNPHSKYIYSGKLDGNGIPPDFFSNLDVRKGFEYLFPHGVYIKEVWNGMGTEPNGPIYKGLLGYDPNIPKYHQNLSKAKEYFKKAYNGELWKKGFKVAIIYNSTDPTMRQACEILKTYAMRANPKFKIILVPTLWASLVNEFLSNEIPLIALDWFSTSSYNRVYGYLSSHGVYALALGQKFREFAQKEFDPLINAAVSAPNLNEAKKIYQEIGMKVYKQALMIWLIHPSRRLVYRKWLKGLYPENYNPFRTKDLVFYNLSK